MAAATGTKLTVTQGAPIRFRFRYRENGVRQNISGFTPRSQIRVRPGGKLLLDLTPYFTVNADDPTALDLYVPGSVTRTLKSNGVWDVFLDDMLIVSGPVDLVLAVTS